MPLGPGAHLRLHKKVIFSLIPLLFLIVMLESVQRVRYYYGTGNADWLYYGFVDRTDEGPGPTDISFRGERGWPTRPGQILAIGGSSTFGVYLDAEEAYPYQLDQMINGSLGGSSGEEYVVNLGYPGASSDEYARILRDALEVGQPAFVIFYAGYNDIFIKATNELYRTLSENSLWIIQAVTEISLVAMTAQEKYWISQQNRATRSLRLEREVQDNMGEVIGLLERRDVPVVLIPEVLMAKRFGVSRDYRSYAARYSHIPTIMREVASEYGAEYLDVQSDFETDDYALDFMDPVHLTSPGTLKLSQVIFERSSTVQQWLKGMLKEEFPLR